jgi:hypothetical protein
MMRGSIQRSAFSAQPNQLLNADMRAKLLLICLLAASLALATASPRAASPSAEKGEWSQEVNGLRARLKLVEKGKRYGTRWLVPYLELRNVRDLINQLEVNIDRRHLKVELVGADGAPVRRGTSMPRSGPTPQLGAIILPRDSSIRVSLECLNWGIPKDAPAMVSTDSGAWVIREDENGKVFLRATLTGEKSNPEWKVWSGDIQTPLVKVVWR